MICLVSVYTLIGLFVYCLGWIVCCLLFGLMECGLLIVVCYNFLFVFVVVSIIRCMCTCSLFLLALRVVGYWLFVVLGLFD